jgi:hypothetical protein
VLADDVVAIERDEEGLVRVDFDLFFISATGGGQHNTATVCVSKVRCSARSVVECARAEHRRRHRSEQELELMSIKSE